MITIGRRNKTLFIGAAILMFIFFLTFSASNGGSSSSSSSLPVSNSEVIQKADFGIGGSTTPTNDNSKANIKGSDDLLPGAEIDNDNTEGLKKPVKQVGLGSEKSDFISGSDASIKAKEDSVKKADGLTNIAGSFADSDNDESDTITGAGKKKAASNAKSDGYEYVIMIDAGSTGSRVHIYSFDTSVAPPALINEEFKMLKPGLSSFDTDTTGAAESLDPLLELALKSIPKEKYSCSPVAVKATAGLRLLGKAKSDAILKEVRRHLEVDYPFPVVEGEGISIMDGSDEGVYAWITTNYLLNNIGSSKKLDTAAVFDLGGGSTQIVFEPVNGETILPGEHKYEIEFGGRQFILYQYSHLGYGLMEARNKVNVEVVKAALKSSSNLKLVALKENEIKTAVATVTLENPCIPLGVEANDVIVKMEDGTKYAVNFVPETDTKTSAGQCKFLTESILNKDLECESESCSFNGIYQPSFDEQFSNKADMFVFSYFYDRLQPIGMPESFTLREVNDIMESVCSGSHLWDQYFTQPAHIKELEGEPLWCLDLNFMSSLLHTGYDIPLTRELKTAKTIGGNELGWCLGASLPLLDKANWSCKVTKEF